MQILPPEIVETNMIWNFDIQASRRSKTFLAPDFAATNQS